MSAKSERQRRFMGAELGRMRAGKKTRTNMSEDELRKMAHKAKAKKQAKSKRRRRRRKGK